MRRSDKLALLLARHLAAGSVKAGEALPALRAVLGPPDEDLSFQDLLDDLRDVDLPHVAALREGLLRKRLDCARAAYGRARTGRPVDVSAWPELAGLPSPSPGWRGESRLCPTASRYFQTCAHLHFVKAERPELTGLAARMERALDDARAAFGSQWNRWDRFLPDTSDWPKETKRVASRLKAGWRRKIDALLHERRGQRSSPGTSQPGSSEAGTLTEDAPDLNDVEIDINEDVLAKELAGRFREAVDADAGSKGAQASTERVERQRKLLDLALVWPSDRMATVLPELCVEPWAQERAAAVLMMRFGKSGFRSWTDWEWWLAGVADQRERRVAEYERVGKAFKEEALLLWYQEQPEPDPAIVEKLEKLVTSKSTGVEAEVVFESWRHAVEPQEVDVLLGRKPLPQEPPPAAEAPAPEAAAKAAEPSAPPAEGPGPEAESPEAPAGPLAKEAAAAASIWRDNIQPFLIENWYVVVGLAMVLVGASLLAYFTWDKHWVWRYTIMPSLLAGFTLWLGAVGGWIERRFPVLRGTAVMLRGGAVALVPINFMALALLSRDEDVSLKALGVSVMAVAYLGVFGWSFRRWCASVDAALTNVQGVTLLVLNALIGIVPICVLATGGSPKVVGMLLAGGLYAGFAVAGLAWGWFVRRSLTAEMLRGRLVPWFLGLSLAVTFLEVFALVHVSLGTLPRALTYSIMAVLAGGLVIFMERRLYRLRGASAGYGGESFIGYALILTGVLMGIASPHVRIAALALAGIVWLFQASLRAGRLQYWIGLTFLMLGGASVALLDAFPKGPELNALPAVGLVMALGFRVLQAFARRYGRERLSQAIRGFLPGLLVLTAVVSVLSQWHYRSDPWQIGAALVLIAGLLAWRAERDHKLAERTPAADADGEANGQADRRPGARGHAGSWVYATMAILALALPYLGCADMRGHAMHGNNMVFGLGTLGALWLVFLRLRSRGPWLRARSTVIFSYGVLALAAMLLRVVVEQSQVAGGGAVRETLDNIGPLLMCVVLVFATYHSRSLVPAVLAAVIGAVLFPELKAAVERAFPMFHFGSGFGSSSAGLALVLLTFPLRRASFLKELGLGDLMYGEKPFPLQRRDHTLFTWPLIGAALFLTAKVDTVNLARNYFGAGVGVKTAVALLITSLSWILLAAAVRRKAFGRVATNLCWVTLLLGFGFLNGHLFRAPQMQMPVLFTGLAMQAVFFVLTPLAGRYAWIDEVIRRPVRGVLAVGGMVLAAGVAVVVVAGEPLAEVVWIAALVAAELVWHALRTRSRRYGVVLFALALVWLVAWTSPGGEWLWDRLSVEHTFTPVLLLALGVALARLALEWWQPARERLKGILTPFHAGSAGLVLVAACVVVWDSLAAPHPPLGITQQVLALVLVALLARAHSAGVLAVALFVMAYLVAHTHALRTLPDVAARLTLLTTPWRLALFGLVSTLLAEAGRRLSRRVPAVFESRIPGAQMALPGHACIFPVAGAAACLATVYYLVDGGYRGMPMQLPAPYLAAATLFAIAIFWRRAPFALPGALALCVGNVQVIDVYAGARLIARGLSSVHVVCLGLTATLVQATAARAIARNDRARRLIRRGGLAAAGAVLILLSMHYFTHPNLAEVSLARFSISGLLAYAAGLWFRWTARRPDPGDEKLSALLEAVYHLGLAIAIWCFALMVPFLRHPNTALVAIGLPPLYFYLRAEYGNWRGSEAAREAGKRYWTSSTLLCFMVLVLYAAKAIFHMILFPDKPFTTDHYHYSSPIAVAAGLLLIRLRGLGHAMFQAEPQEVGEKGELDKRTGAAQAMAGFAAFYGGLAVVVGTYFGVTAWPGLSPFGFPVAAAWTAVLISHFFLLVWSRHSPVRAALQGLGKLESEEWEKLRRTWGHVLLWASVVVAVFALADHASDPYAVAPFLAAVASLFLHAGVVGAAKGRVKAYLVAAGAIFAVALHADFVLPSYLAGKYVVWAVLALWAALLAGDRQWSRWTSRGALTALSGLLLAVSFAHVVYHRPWSPVGLAAMAVAGVLWALTPRDERRASGGAGELAAGLPLLWAPWLVYFAQVWRTGMGPRGMIETWPVLSLVAALLVTGALARACSRLWALGIEQWDVRRPRVVHQTAGWLAERGLMLNSALLWITLVIIGIVQVARYGGTLGAGEITFFAAIWIGAAVAWFIEGRERKSTAANVIAQLCVGALVILCRKQLMLRVDWWTEQYDVWFALAASAGFAGAKPWIDKREAHLRRPLSVSQLALPALALTWTLFHNLGTDVTLVVLGVNSLIFTYLGRGKRASKYNIVAVAGLVAFVAVLFWQKLDLRVLQAYVIPVGLGLLVLLHLFGKDMKAEIRSGVRMSILLAMIGSAGYHALLDDRYPVAFHLTMILLGLASMGVGSFLRVRLYVLLGGGTVLVDLAALGYKFVAKLERTYQMTIIGTLLLLVGVAVVAGSVYYKTQRETVELWLAKVRKRLGAWE